MDVVHGGQKRWGFCKCRVAPGLGIPGRCSEVCSSLTCREREQGLQKAALLLPEVGGVGELTHTTDRQGFLTPMAGGSKGPHSPGYPQDALQLHPSWLPAIRTERTQRSSPNSPRLRILHPASQTRSSAGINGHSCTGSNGATSMYTSRGPSRKQAVPMEKEDTDELAICHQPKCFQPAFSYASA